MKPGMPPAMACAAPGPAKYPAAALLFGNMRCAPHPRVSTAEVVPPIFLAMTNGFTKRYAHDDNESTHLHQQRLDAVMQCLLDSSATSVLDLGCGCGLLLRRLIAQDQFTRIVAIDHSLQAVDQAMEMLNALGESGSERVSLRMGSITDLDEELAGFDAAVLVETIEHIPPSQLSKVEQSLFGQLRPRLVVMTTPNRDYNAVLGMGRSERRHSDHQFEWSQSKFQKWVAGIAARHGFDVEFQAIGADDDWRGGPTQRGVMRRRAQGAIILPKQP
jgi:small RNA 2'-O-methyltransferase